MRRGANRAVDHRHDLLDLVDDSSADIVDAVGEAGRRKICVVDLIDIGAAQRPGARERFVDRLIERRIVAGRVGVPDLIISRVGRLAQGPDLAERDFGECHRAFVLVRFRVHIPAAPRGIRVHVRPRISVFHRMRGGLNVE
jgi:hypothetical protein